MKYQNDRNTILDNLSFTRIKFCHGADFSDSSLVNATLSVCDFYTSCNYSFDRCDLQDCRFMKLTGNERIRIGHRIGHRLIFLEMIKKKIVTFSDVKNLDQAIFEDEQVKSAIKKTFSL